MEFYTIEDTIRNFDAYFELENLEDERKGQAVDLLLAMNQVIKNPVDKAVLTLFCESDWGWEVERLSIFNGITSVYETLDKFINVFVQYFENHKPLLSRVDHLNVTEEMFGGWEIVGDEGKEELIDLLLGGEELILTDPEEDL